MLIKDFDSFITDTLTKEKLDIVKGKEEYGFTKTCEKPNPLGMGWIAFF